MPSPPLAYYGRSGRHCFTCGANRSLPHDELRDAFLDLGVAAGVTTKSEPSNILTSKVATSQCRPDALMVNLGAGGKDVIVDFTTTDVSSKTNLNNPSCSYRRRGVSARAAEGAKRKLYAKTFNRDRYVFVAAAIEMDGRWGDGLENLFSDLCRYAIVHKGLDKFRASIFKSYWRKVINVRFFRSVFQGACHMLDQIASPGDSLDRSRELALR